MNNLFPKKQILLAHALLFVLPGCIRCATLSESVGVTAVLKPLFADPVYDGAADPFIIWNKKGKEWLMFYTVRSAIRGSNIGFYHLLIVFCKAE